MTIRMIWALVLVGALAACRPGGPNNEDGGTVIGAIAGGVIGNQFGGGRGRIATTAVGALVGGFIGNKIGRSLDDADRRAAERAQFFALERGESGVATPWRNPDSGHYGSVVPRRPYRRGARDCRDYEHTIYIGGSPEVARGTACRNGDGTWTPVG